MQNLQSKIAIIGAGLAGLTIAYRLKQKGYNVALYEARSRVGGRIHSVYIQNTEGGISVAELGGQNINDGGDAKNILDLAKEFGIEVVHDNLNFTSLYHDGETYHDTKSILSRIPNCLDLFKEMHRLSPLYKNMREVLDQLFPTDSKLNRLCSFFLNSYEGSPPELLSSYHNCEILEMMISWFYDGLYRNDINKPTRIFFKNGTASLALKIAEKLNDDLHLSMPLETLCSNSNNTIDLVFKGGSHATCEQLIFAIPCSVFNDIKIDKQILELAHQEKLKKIQYGSNAKILYPISYGPTTHSMILTDKVASFFNGDKCLTNLYFINDDGDSKLVDQDLGKFLPIIKNGYANCQFTNQPPVEPLEEQYTFYTAPVAKSWIKDPFSRGSYSGYGIYINEELDKKTKVSGIEFKKLFAPINNQVFFAGEHATILPEIGTMEAAVESAERLANLF